MKHKFYFTGYSDDVVLAGADKRSMDEYYTTYYMMNNGVQVKAEHGPSDDPDHPGWKITSEHPNAIRIPAPGEDAAHTDPRIPDWLDAEGYCDVLIVESDEPLEIVTMGAKPQKPLTMLGLLSAKITKELNSAKDEDEGVCVDDVEAALKKHLPPLWLLCQKYCTEPTQPPH